VVSKGAIINKFLKDAIPVAKFLAKGQSVTSGPPGCIKNFALFSLYEFVYIFPYTAIKVHQY